MENKGLSICIDKEHLDEVGLKAVSDMVSKDFKIDISSESNKIVVKYPDGSEEHFYKKSD